MTTAYPRYSAAHALRTGGPDAARQALLAARAGTLAQFAAWSQALGPQPVVPYREGLNPLLWELGHLAWFQEYWVSRNRQRARGTSCQPEHARAPSLLSEADAWYDSSRVAHRSRWTLPLPDAQATLEYLADTLDVTLALLDRLPPDAGDDALYFFRLVALHEHMHGEAGAYMARALGIPVPPVSAASQAAAGPRRSLHIPAQTFRTGIDGPGFAFDNEQCAHDVGLEAFEIDSRPVSSAEFMGFAEAGGYQARRWWSEPGWAWLQQQPGPLAADAAGAGPHAPALHVSAHEAEAWCRWAGRRLPSEAEWECAALTVTGFAWGAAWEWTASPFTPYPGFVAHPYRDYSQPWFHSRRVLRGACAATSGWLAHPRYRNFFEPGRRDIFAGFRSCA